jgi:hypothetical protein
MNVHPEAQLTGRQRRRLRLARENGYLNAACRDPRKLLEAYSRWCWRLRIPVVWSERHSPRSRYGRVRLDLYTTAIRLTAAGQAELQDLAPRASMSPHDARWEHVPVRDLDRIAAAVFRACTRAANYQPNRGYPPAFLAGMPAKVFVMDQPRAASA